VSLEPKWVGFVIPVGASFVAFPGIDGFRYSRTKDAWNFFLPPEKILLNNDWNVQGNGVIKRPSSTGSSVIKMHVKMDAQSQGTTTHKFRLVLGVTASSGGGQQVIAEQNFGEVASGHYMHVDLEAFITRDNVTEVQFRFYFQGAAGAPETPLNPYWLTEVIELG